MNADPTLDVKTILDALKVAGGIATTFLVAAGAAIWKIIAKQQKSTFTRIDAGNASAILRVEAAHAAEILILRQHLTDAKISLSEANLIVKRCIERDAQDNTANVLKEQLAEMRSDLNESNQARLDDLRTNSQVTEGVLNACLDGVRAVNQNLVSTQATLRNVLEDIREIQNAVSKSEVIGQKIDVLAERMALLAEVVKKGV